MHHPLRCLLVPLLGLSLSTLSPVIAAPPERSYEKLVRPFLSQHCFDCHGEAVQERDLRLDTVPARFTADAAGPVWEKVLRRLKAGEMPPADMPRPPANQLEAVTRWIEARLIAEDAARLEREGRIPLRRMTAGEYEHTIWDLLQIDASPTASTSWPTR
jgi:hypothetical protein